jgi:ribose-phosphate pyrophosphokinase
MIYNNEAMKHRMMLFALSASKSLAQKVAQGLHVPLAKVEITQFADGELMVRSLDSVRDANVYVIQSTSTPATQHLMELLVFVDSLKRGSAHEINVVIPYYGYARQDRIARPREPITAKLVADLLTAAGVNRVVTIDIHTSQIQGFFSIPVDTLSALPLMAQSLRLQLDQEKIALKDVTVISPDHGSILRGRDLATLLPGSQLGLIDKRRPEPNVAEVMALVGEVKNKTVVVIDDIIDTAGTMIGAIEILKKHQAKSIWVCATHAVFSLDAVQQLTRLGLKRILVSDTIDHPAMPGIEKISIAPMLIKVIDHLEQGLPLTPIYEDYNVY